MDWNRWNLIGTKNLQRPFVPICSHNHYTQFRPANCVYFFFPPPFPSNGKLLLWKWTRQPGQSDKQLQEDTGSREAARNRDGLRVVMTKSRDKPQQTTTSRKKSRQTGSNREKPRQAAKESRQAAAGCNKPRQAAKESRQAVTGCNKPR